MTPDDIASRILERETELADVRADLVNGPQDNPPPALVARRNELMTEIAKLKTQLEDI